MHRRRSPYKWCWIAWLLSLSLCLGHGAAATRHTLMAEDVGVVNPLDTLGATFHASSILAAIAAVGSAPRTLLLPEGVWTIDANVTVPANIVLWIPRASSVVVEAGQTLTLVTAPRIDVSPWWSGPGTVVQPPGDVAVGTSGVLQVSDGAGAFAAYPGTFACSAGSFLNNLSATGVGTCEAPTYPSHLAHLLTDRAEIEVPNALNLALFPRGVLQITPASGVAQLSSRTAPTGALVGTTDVQTLTHKAVQPRSVNLPATTTPVVVDVDTTDLVMMPEILQVTQIGAPTGTATEGQMVRLKLHSTLPRVLTWDAAWSAEQGLALPSTTTGGETWDILLFEYNANTSHFTLVYTSQLLREMSSVALTPGNYPCPALDVSRHGLIVGVTAGDCAGGGSGGSVGPVGDIQLSGGAGTLTSDDSRLTYDKGTHTLTSQIHATGRGISYLALTDISQHVGLFVADQLSENRTYTVPDRSGVIALTDLSLTAGHLVSVGTQGQLIDGGAPPTTVATATALAANGSNCSAGQFPLGVSAAGAAENCTVRTGAVQLPPQSVKFPATNPATLDNSETNARLLFDNATAQCVFWQFTTPLDYASTPSVQLIYSMVSVTSGTLAFDVSVMVGTDSSADLNTESYDTANACDDAAVPGTAGQTHTITCALTNNDTMAAGKFTKVQLCRDVASDDAAGIAEVLLALLTYTK